MAVLSHQYLGERTSEHARTFHLFTASEAIGCSLDQLQTPFGAVSGTAVGDHMPGEMQSMLPEFDPYMPAVTAGPQNVQPPMRQQEGQAGDLMYMCDMCPLEFQRKGQLKIHRLSHIGKKPFKCTFCRYVTADKSDLVTHTRTHTSEKPFSCKLCTYKCARRSHLASHMCTHTGEKQHKCPFCPYASAWKINLTRHVQLCHQRLNLPPQGNLG